MTALIYELIYVISVTLTALFYYCGLTGMEKISTAMYAAVFIPSVFLSLLHHLRLKGRLMLLGITGAGLIGVIIVYSQYSDTISPENHRLALALLLISVASYAAAILMVRLYPAMLCASLICLIFLVLTLTSIIHPMVPGIFFAMFIILISLADVIQFHWHKEGFTDRKTHIVYTAPFIALIVIAASLMHYPEKPYDWKEFIAIRDGMFEAASRIGYTFYPGSDVITGFSDDGYLLTGLGSSDKTELIITTRSDIGAPVYLTGTISDSFDGHRWKSTDNSSIPERMIDVIESISSVKSYSDELRDYYKKTDISVEYSDLKSKYLLAPSKLASKDSRDSSLTAEEKGGVLSFKRYNPYHLIINESFLLANTDNTAFRDFMRSSASPGEQEWKEALQAIKPADMTTDLSYEKYPAYKEHMLKVYSEDVPLSAELKEKTSMLYEGTESSFEKMKRLEAAFQTMEYTLNPPPIPDEVTSSSEFLDYFLLGGGGGYCSYYATAFVLLARAEGLPARYVQGYRIPTDKKGAYRGTSGMAHAWPEVYFEGKGWIAFEPTPGYYSESLWATKIDSAADNTPSIPEQKIFYPPVSATVSEATAKGTTESHRISAYALLVPFSLIAAFFILFIVISRLIRQRNISRLDNEAKLMYLAKDSMNILKLMGKGIREDETLTEYRQRIQTDTGSEALEFIPGYEELLYSDHKNHMTSDKYKSCRDRLLEQLKRKNRFKYLIKILI